MKENIWKKIKRIFSIGLSSLFVALPAASTEAKNTTTIDDSKKIEDYLEDDKNNDIFTEDKDGNLSVSKEVISQRQEQTTSDFREEIKVTKEQIKQNEEHTTRPSQAISYNKLLEQFNNEFNKKKFDKTSYKYLKAVLDNVYKNYDDWYETSKDLPSKEKYIKDNIINNIKNINTIKFYSENSKEGIENAQRGEASGYTDDNFNIVLIYGEDEADTIERTAHELNHIDQKNIVFNNQYFKGYEYLRSVIIEGGASTNMKYANPLKVEKMASNFIRDNNYELEYKADTGSGYPKEMNIYNNLQFLCGYNVMESLKEGKPISTLESTISKKYGSDISNSIFRELKNMYNAQQNDNKKQEMESAVKLQKEFLSCIEKDISSLNKKSHVIKYANIYRMYKLNNLAQMYNGEKNVTNSYFSINSLDEKMADKIIKTNAFKFSTNQQENKKLVKSLLYTTTEEFEQDDGSEIYVPTNLNDVKYKVQNENLIISYKEGDKDITAILKEGRITKTARQNGMNELVDEENQR